MSNTRKVKNARRTAVVMAGIAATTLATGGAEAASAASGAPHIGITSGVIYACYSNTTKTLTHTTKTAGCKTGFTELSWNAQGPQGAKGPQGATGPQGAKGPAAGNATGRFSSHPIGIAANTSTIVASIAPPQGGEFLVNGTATGQKFSSGGFLACRLVNESLRTGSLFSPTPYGYNNTGFTYGTAAENGAMFASASDPIQERCLTNAASGASVITATINDTLVTSLNGAKAHKPVHRPLANRFTQLPKPVKGGDQTVSGIVHKSRP